MFSISDNEIIDIIGSDFVL